jgi:hypothetical protein
VNLKLLESTPPWEWPPDAADTFKSYLRNRRASESDRLTAVEFAGDLVVMDDEIAELLLDIVGNGEEPETVRAKAAISLGPVLQQMDMESIDDEVGFPEEYREEPPVTKETFARIQSTLHSIYQDETVPKLVRRRILEASIRAREEWHADAIRRAYASPDEEWKLTAVFGMRNISGFEKEILEALNSPNEDIHYEAIRATGDRELTRAWPHIRSLLQSVRTPKMLLLAAIGASVYVNPGEAGPLLERLCDSRDEEIAEAAGEAMMEASAAEGDFLDEEDEDDEDDESHGGGYVN